MSRLQRLRQQAGALVVDNAFWGASALGRLHPFASPQKQGVVVTRDVPYLVDEDDRTHVHTLDLYRPVEAASSANGASGPLPVVLYVHGGGFRVLSKDTHWIMALAFARRGFLVYNINYRLAPRHPYPAALADVCAAFRHVVATAASLGGDLSKLVLAGESAGANLVTALSLCCVTRRPEPFAAAVFDTGVVPKVVLPACGIFQVSDVDRLHRRRPLPAFLRDRLREVEESYLHRAAPSSAPLADPLLLIERGLKLERPLPPYFLPVGTRDPLLDDSRRLQAALRAHGAVAEMTVYPGEMHAFHALVFREAARQCWRDQFAFLERHLAHPLRRRPAAEQRVRQPIGGT